MKEALQRVETGFQLTHRGWHEEAGSGSGCRRSSSGATELTRGLGLAATASAGRRPWHLADEGAATGQGVEPLEAMHHCIDIVRHLADVVDRLAFLRPRSRSAGDRIGSTGVPSICEGKATASLRTYM